MTLHEEIHSILMARGEPMATTEIAAEINRRRNYVKRDGSPVTETQVFRRTRTYCKLFVYDGSKVGLVEWHVKDFVEP